LITRRFFLIVQMAKPLHSDLALRARVSTLD
jgi:hypothetical protein